MAAVVDGVEGAHHGLGCAVVAVIGRLVFLRDGLARIDGGVVPLALRTALHQQLCELAAGKIKAELVVVLEVEDGRGGIDELDAPLLVVEVFLVILPCGEVVLLDGEVEIERGVDLLITVAPLLIVHQHLFLMKARGGEVLLDVCGEVLGHGV